VLWRQRVAPGRETAVCARKSRSAQVDKRQPLRPAIAGRPGITPCGFGESGSVERAQATADLRPMALPPRWNSLQPGPQGERHGPFRPCPHAPAALLRAYCPQTEKKSVSRRVPVAAIGQRSAVQRHDARTGGRFFGRRPCALPPPSPALGEGLAMDMRQGFEK
jgi:hypothetical protein